MMFGLITDTYSQMPGWAQFLIVWPLPSLLVAQILTYAYRKQLANPHRYENQGIGAMIISFSVFWPLAAIVLFAGTIIESTNWLKKKSEQIAKWFKNKRAARRRVKEYRAKEIPKSPDSTHHIHYYKNKRTRCGVGNPKEAHTTNILRVVTCPICLGLMENDRRNEA